MIDVGNALVPDIWRFCGIWQVMETSRHAPKAGDDTARVKSVSPAKASRQAVPVVTLHLMVSFPKMLPTTIQPEEKASEGFGGKENIRRWFPL